MQRDLYNSVTHIPVLIPCGPGQDEDGMANFLHEGALFNRVRILRDAELNMNTEPGKKLWGQISKRERQRLLALIAFRKAIEEKDALAIANLEAAYRHILVEVLNLRQRSTVNRDLEASEVAKAQSAIHTWARWFAKESGPSTGAPQRILAEVLSSALGKAQIVLWWQDTKRRFLPAIYCPDVASALYVRALVKFAGGRSFLVCPHCGDFFVQERSDQDYCSIRCREAHRVARWREQQRTTKRHRRRKRAKVSRRTK